MARSSTSMCRSIAALSRGSFSRSPLKSTSSSSSLLPPALCQPSCRISRLRGAIVSLQALHAARSQALFVSKLSFGPVFLMQGQPLCALTVL
eukprot:c18971_g1_i1 orf=371-646(-)